MTICNRLFSGGLAATLLALPLTACADDESASESAAPPVAAAVTAEADDAVEVGLDDFAFVGLPTTVAAGTRLTVENRAEHELHELVAFRLDASEQRTVEELTELSPQELVASLGEPVTVLLAEPGGDPIPAVGDGTLEASGRYAIMCFIPTGVEPAEYLRAAAETDEGPPQIEGAGPPHFVQGMFAELTVE